MSVIEIFHQLRGVCEVVQRVLDATFPSIQGSNGAEMLKDA